MFKEALALSGIVLTKLDGTAKGGVILGICAEQKFPVRYIGIGERAEDLRDFVPEEFVEAMFGRGDPPRAAARCAAPPEARHRLAIGANASRLTSTASQARGPRSDHHDRVPRRRST